MDSFAEKMKGWIPGIICLALFHFSCGAQTTRQRESMVGLDCTETVRALGLGLDFHHSIDSRWSVSAGILLHPFTHKEIYDEEEKSHYEEFGSGIPYFRQEEDMQYISLHYWTRKVFEGTEFGWGIINSSESVPDMTVEIGYFAGIHKGIALGFRFKTKIIESYRKRCISGKELRITLNWIF